MQSWPIDHENKNLCNKFKHILLFSPCFYLEIICFPPVISSGNFRPQKDKYTLGNTISVECDAGYHFKVVTGSGATAECTKNGWVPEPACVRK